MAAGDFSYPTPPPARNEPVKDYAPSSPERQSLQTRLEEMSGERIEIPMVIGGREVSSGDLYEAVKPHDRKHVLADVHQSSAQHLGDAIEAAAKAKQKWASTALAERAAIFLRASELLAGPWRDTRPCTRPRSMPPAS
jgi:1-pyrroline-5-carboxylate dehydrogenase